MRAAISFLTPLGGARTPSPAAWRWFPVVGAALGAALGAGWWFADRLWPRPVAAALVVGADLAVTGLLHVDGLIDSADGLLPHLPRERRLAVMAEPDVGAFGVAVAAAMLLLRWVALASMSPSVALLAALWCASRSAMAVAALTVPYARAGEGGGLASAFLPASGARGLARIVGLLGIVVAGVLAMAWRPLAGLAVLAVAWVAGGAVVLLARRRIGGFTGDVLGALGMVAETAGLIVAAGRW
jgi:cobalamin 5'-phosphate synthase/cobalamin synthase